MTNTYPITKTTLRKLGIVLFNTCQWLKTDAKYSHPNASIRDLLEITNEVRSLLGMEIAMGEQNDILGEISSGAEMAKPDDNHGTVSPSHENQESRVEGS